MTIDDCALDSENELNLIRQYLVPTGILVYRPVKFMVLLISNACLETQTVAAFQLGSMSRVAANDVGYWASIISNLKEPVR